MKKFIYLSLVIISIIGIVFSVVTLALAAVKFTGIHACGAFLIAVLGLISFTFTLITFEEKI